MNDLANDQVTWSPNFEAYGNTYIVWGTEGIANGLGQNPANNYFYIVVSANESQRIEEIDIENGAGFEAVVILLMKGIDVEINVVDDSNIAPPVIANNPFALVTPYGTVSMLLVASKADQARKREGMRTFTFKSFTAIPVL